ncbi:MAG: sigma-70 family RNA polymerase sigma factor [Deltaproteobacteria bacterium]|nr:sigma-70 family RNA polymerase sigma factor [Deltaproteobacteria bacterium]MBN2674522.1 sigma-70 family RNA polymerase sigma factor [Deltaproteobacteria bacterium]
MDIYQRYGPALIRKCTRMLGSVEDAEDIVQGLFYDLLKKGKTDVDLPYLYRASTNRCLNMIRNSKKRANLLSTQAKVTAQHNVTRTDEPSADRDLLEKVIQKLDKKSRQILVYRFYDDMTQEEIAQLTGYSRKTIGKKLQLIRNTVIYLSEGSGLQAGFGGHS